MSTAHQPPRTTESNRRATWPATRIAERRRRRPTFGLSSLVATVVLAAALTSAAAPALAAASLDRVDHAAEQQQDRRDIAGFAPPLETDVASVVLRFDLDRAELGRQSEGDLERLVVGETAIRHGGIGTADTFVCDGPAGRMCPDYDGSEGRVLALRHPAGRHYAGTWNGLIRFPPLREGWLSYRVRYGPTWDPSQQRGKLWGLAGVSPSGSELGRDRPPMHGAEARPGDGWSARRAVHRHGMVVDYLYDPAKDRAPFRDNPYGDRAWWGADGATDGTNRHVDGWWRGQRLIRNGRWYRLDQHIDVDAGLIQSYLDGHLVARTTNRPLVEAGAPLNALAAHAYIGSAGNPSHTQHREVWTYLTDITVTTGNPLAERGSGSPPPQSRALEPDAVIGALTGCPFLQDLAAYLAEPSPTTADRLRGVLTASPDEGEVARRLTRPLVACLPLSDLVWKERS